MSVMPVRRPQFLIHLLVFYLLFGVSYAKADDDPGQDQPQSREFPAIQASPANGAGVMVSGEPIAPRA